MNKQTFASLLKGLRERAGLTQTRLAERAGMNQFGIARLEQGVREPTWQTVQALARALGVSCSAFESEETPAEEPARPRGRPRKDAGPSSAEGASPAKKTRKRKEE
jgi:transcriptional regulator with XRE-family HTH domain